MLVDGKRDGDGKRYNEFMLEMEKGIMNFN